MPGSGRRRSVRTDSNIELVNDLICSQQGQPGTSKSPREIALERLEFHFFCTLSCVLSSPFY